MTEIDPNTLILVDKPTFVCLLKRELGEYKNNKSDRNDVAFELPVLNFSSLTNWFIQLSGGKEPESYQDPALHGPRLQLKEKRCLWKLVFNSADELQDVLGPSFYRWNQGDCCTYLFMQSGVENSKPFPITIFGYYYEVNSYTFETEGTTLSLLPQEMSVERMYYLRVVLSKISSDKIDSKDLPAVFAGARGRG